MTNKYKILSIALITLLVIPLVMADSQLFKDDLKETAKDIYYGTLNFLANAFLPLFIIISAMILALIIISIFVLLGRIFEKIGR
jgi:hypothetical protein